MMTAAIALLALVAQDQKPPPRASEIVSKMLSHYSGAQSITGTIKLRQGANGQMARGSMDTEIQFERPSKLYIKQVQNTADWGTITVLDPRGRPREAPRTSPPTWLVTSDGVLFSYDTADDSPGNRQRLLEKVMPRPSEVLDVRGIYTAVARSLGDRSVPLEIAIGRTDDLRHFTRQLVTLEYAGRTKLGEEDVNVVRGQWRDVDMSERVAGKYEIFVTDQGDFRKYAIYQTVQPSKGSQPIDVVSVWDIALTVNGKPDPDLFRVVK